MRIVDSRPLYGDHGEIAFLRPENRLIMFVKDLGWTPCGEHSLDDEEINFVAEARREREEESERKRKLNATRDNYYAALLDEELKDLEHSPLYGAFG